MFSKSNQIAPLADGINDLGSISRGDFVFGFNFTRKFLRMVTNPTFDCINPNLIPVNVIKLKYLEYSVLKELFISLLHQTDDENQNM